MVATESNESAIFQGACGNCEQAIATDENWTVMINEF